MYFGYGIIAVYSDSRGIRLVALCELVWGIMLISKSGVVSLLQGYNGRCAGIMLINKGGVD